MKNLTLISILTLSMLGCSTDVMVRSSFPNVPSELKEPCAELNILPENTNKLSDVLTSVTKNYSEYHVCKIKVQMWMEWYDTQKKIHDDIDN